jgi:hypothetical protein
MDGVREGLDLEVHRLLAEFHKSAGSGPYASGAKQLG